MLTCLFSTIPAALTFLLLWLTLDKQWRSAGHNRITPGAWGIAIKPRALAKQTLSLTVDALCP